MHRTLEQYARGIEKMRAIEKEIQKHGLFNTVSRDEVDAQPRRITVSYFQNFSRAGVELRWELTHELLTEELAVSCRLMLSADVCRDPDWFGLRFDCASERWEPIMCESLMKPVLVKGKRLLPFPKFQPVPLPPRDGKPRVRAIGEAQALRQVGALASAFRSQYRAQEYLRDPRSWHVE